MYVCMYVCMYMYIYIYICVCERQNELTEPVYVCVREVACVSTGIRAFVIQARHMSSILLNIFALRCLCIECLTTCEYVNGQVH